MCVRVCVLQRCSNDASCIGGQDWMAWVQLLAAQFSIGPVCPKTLRVLVASTCRWAGSSNQVGWQLSNRP